MLYLAYTREDALFAIRLTEDLLDAGIELWVDANEIGPLADWDAAQRAAIEASEGIIAVLSPEAMEREHMEREIGQAFERGKTVYVAVARRAPWQEWLRGLPIADFSRSYEQGLADLMLLIMEGKAGRSGETDLDPAEEFLRQAENPQVEDDAKKRRSWLGRLFRRDN